MRKSAGSSHRLVAARPQPDSRSSGAAPTGGVRYREDVSCKFSLVSFGARCKYWVGCG